MDELINFFSYDVVVKAAKLLLWILFILVSIALLRKLLKRRIADTSIRYKAQKGVEVAGYLLIGLLILVSFTLENIADYTIIIGLFTAGITFTLQELILSITGSFFIFLFGSTNRATVSKSTGSKAMSSILTVSTPRLWKWANG